MHAPAARHCLNSVPGQVPDHLFYLRFVSIDKDRLFRRREPDLVIHGDIRAMLEQGEAITYGSRKVDRAVSAARKAVIRRPGERQKAGDNCI